MKTINEKIKRAKELKASIVGKKQQIQNYRAYLVEDMQKMERELDALIIEITAEVPTLEFPKDKKSTLIEGVEVGMRVGRAKVEISGDANAVIANLKKERPDYIRIKEEVNKTHFLAHPFEGMEELGVKIIPGEDEPFIRL